MGYDVDPLDVIERGTRYKHAVQSGATLHVVSCYHRRDCLRVLAHIRINNARWHLLATMERVRSLK